MLTWQTFYQYSIPFLTSVLFLVNPLSANPTKWSNTLKQFVGFCQRIVWMWCVWSFLVSSLLTSKHFSAFIWRFYPWLWIWECLFKYTINRNQSSVASLLCSLKISENQRASDVFRWYEKGTLAWNRLKKWSKNKHFFILCKKDIKMTVLRDLFVGIWQFKVINTGTKTMPLNLVIFSSLLKLKRYITTRFDMSINSVFLVIPISK